MNNFLKLLLGSGLFLLEQSDRTRNVCDRASRKVDDLRDVVRHGYEEAADRVTRASRAIRGKNNHVLGNAVRLAAGIGVGIGVGVLLAPASGKQTRSTIAGTIQNFGSRVRKQVVTERARATTNAG